jgi:transcriptional regulator of arginine metabolism
MRMRAILCAYLCETTVPNSPETQSERQAAIRQLLGKHPAGTQRSLVNALISQGFEATQSSVSRDLKELGAVKTASGYELPGHAADEDEVAKVSSLIREIEAAGPNLLVIKTEIGAAQRVALALDRSGWPEMVGNVGGDDTVFVATKSASGQRNLLSKIDRASAQGSSN